MIHNIQDAILNIDIQSWISSYGDLAIALVCLILFSETGLLFGFFLPGDTVLFPTGLAIASGAIHFPLWLACVLFAAAAWLGDQTGYWLGRKVGPAIFNRPESRLFKHENVDRAHAFFERYGAKAIILAHFVPIMRTFIPVAAGVGEMPYRSYLKYNIFGVVGWTFGVPLLGALLGQISFIAKHVELVTVAFLVISFIPIALEWVRARRDKKTNRAGK
ncbi:MAG: DedA family protein [Rhodoluna sp.]